MDSSGAPTLPSTPKRSNAERPKDTLGALQSSPLNVKGTASQSPLLTTGELKDVTTSFAEDLKKRASTAELNNFLRFLLSYSTGNKDQAKLSDDLNQLLDLSVDICHSANPVSEKSRLWRSSSEGKQSSSGLVPENGHNIEERLRADWDEHLKSYGQQSKETARYTPFIKLTNSILRTFDEDPYKAKLKDLGLSRKFDAGQRIVFQRNDPKLVSTQYSGRHQKPLQRNVLRKPDIVLLSLEAALLLHPNNPGLEPAVGDARWEARFHEYGQFDCQPPQIAPSFPQIKVALEFKVERTNLDHLVVPSFYPNQRNYCGETPQSLFEPNAKPRSKNVSVSKASGKSRNGKNLASKNTSSAKTPSPSGNTRNHQAASEPEPITQEVVAMLQAHTPPAIPEVETSESRQQANLDANNLPAPIKSAIYAGGKLSASPDLHHTLGAVVRDNVLYLWWYDRGGAVQSHGLNFFENLPYLVALLAILDHFDNEDFGQHPAFVPSESTSEGLSTFKLTLHGEGAEASRAQFELSFDPSKSRMHYSLFGRGTSVHSVTSSSANPLHPATTLTDVPMVAKIYYPEEQRTSEVDMLKIAHHIAGHAKGGYDRGFVAGHLPLLVASLSQPNKYSAVIDDILRPKDAGRINCSFRILVFFKLELIHELVGNEFVKAFMDCMLCHWGLAKNRLLHRDISMYNLMYYRTPDGQVMGVVIDFDLAMVEGYPRNTGLDRTGTLAYMAQNLLKRMDGATDVPHIYEFDLESFYYVLVWITGSYEGRHLASTAISDVWLKSLNPEAIANAKRPYMKTKVDLALVSHRQANDLIVDLASLVLTCIEAQNTNDSALDSAQSAITSANRSIARFLNQYGNPALDVSTLTTEELHTALQAALDAAVGAGRLSRTRARKSSTLVASLETAKSKIDAIERAKLWPSKFDHPRTLFTKVLEAYATYWDNNPLDPKFNSARAYFYDLAEHYWEEIAVGDDGAVDGGGQDPKTPSPDAAIDQGADVSALPATEDGKTAKPSDEVAAVNDENTARKLGAMTLSNSGMCDGFPMADSSLQAAAQVGSVKWLEGAARCNKKAEDGCLLCFWASVKDVYPI